MYLTICTQFYKKKNYLYTEVPGKKKISEEKSNHTYVTLLYFTCRAMIVNSLTRVKISTVQYKTQATPFLCNFYVI